MQRIIDFHNHIFPEKIAEKAVTNLEHFYDLGVACKGTPEDLSKGMEKAGIHTAVALATATRADQVSGINRWLGGLISEKLVGFGALHPDAQDLDGEISEIERLGLKGVKLHPDFQEVPISKMYPIFERLEGRLPVLIHMGDFRTEFSSPKQLSKVLDTFPKLTVIGAHMGGWSEWEEASHCLYGRENLYLDTSSTLPFLKPETVAGYIRAHGAHRVLFGTDYPMWRHDEELERFGKLPLTEKERQMILYENAAKLLGLE